MKFTLSGNLLRFADFRKEISIEAPTIRQGLYGLVETCPDLRPVILDGEGTFREVHRLFLNDEIIMNEDLDKVAGPNDEVAILTAIAGG